MKILYVSYDGALDPLGASQVVPYLRGLADQGCEITLISFEKREHSKDEGVGRSTREGLASRSIVWRPLRYHKRPRLTVTLWDIAIGSRAIAAEAQRSAPDLVHCRGDIAMTMARLAGLPRRTRLVYDVRGFFSDERVETGSWRRGSPVDRVVQRLEAGNLHRADGVVVLTRAAVPELRRRRPLLPPCRVIPTCVDTSLFFPRTSGQEAHYGLVYSGSLGSWYMGGEMVGFARSTGELFSGPTLFLTPQTEEGRRLGVTDDWAEIRTVDPAAVPGWLRRARAMFFFNKPGPSKKASHPTKFAEGLASGLPVVCNRGIGDLDGIVDEERVGVLVDSFSAAAYNDAGRRLQLLLQDSQLAARCRRLAESRYSLALGVDAYHQLYRNVLSGDENAVAMSAGDQSSRGEARL